ncbi:MAG: ABC transporter permease [Firmicutes bacterium]|nr:ABC transporter permease [Bacillota bacterium]
MSMNAWILMGRDFSTRIKGIPFILTTILGVVVIVALSFGPTIMEWLESSFEHTVVDVFVVDKTNTFAPIILEVVEENPRDNLFITVDSELDEKNAFNMMAELNKTGVLVIERLESGESVFTLHSTNATNMMQNSILQSVLNQAMTRIKANELGLSPYDIAQLFQQVPLAVSYVQEGTDEDSTDESISYSDHSQSMVLAYFLIFFLYMAFILYGNMIASGVAEEKSSRIMEVMVATVKPMDLMIGKVLGIGALGLLQFTIWIIVGIVMASVQNLGLSLSSIPLSILIWFGIFFVLGFLFYATIFAATGATVSRVEEVQQGVTMIMMFIMVGFFVSFFSFSNPNGTLATVSSFIPFFSPMVMFTRIVLGQPPVLQIAASVIILLISIVISTWLAARIYRVGILLYGKRLSIKEIFRYLIEPGY